MHRGKEKGVGVEGGREAAPLRADVGDESASREEGKRRPSVRMWGTSGPRAGSWAFYEQIDGFWVCRYPAGIRQVSVKYPSHFIYLKIRKMPDTLRIRIRAYPYRIGIRRGIRYRYAIFGKYPRNVGRDNGEALAELGLEAKQRRPPGQEAPVGRQRLDVAMARLNKPRARDNGQRRARLADGSREMAMEERREKVGPAS
ncbi:hypothetical protein ACP70R_019185 [Stipagrostis hirtigluma subsp. patula]